MRRGLLGIVAAAAIVAVLGVVGSFVYINFIKDDAPAPLQSTAQGVNSSADVDGTYGPTGDSQVGYRVKEILFGQDTEAVGRTSNVTGDLRVDGLSVTAVSLTVDVASIVSDSDQRDGQFRGRIMNTSQFPNATFVLSEPIALERRPDESAQRVSAKGDLTLRGTTKQITLDLTVRNTTQGVEVTGNVPVDFPEWKIPNPTGGPARVGDDGALELQVFFKKA